MRPPFTIDHLTLALSALTEGFGIHGATGLEHPRVDWRHDDDRVGADWTLFGVAAWALIERLTEPAATAAGDPG